MTHISKKERTKSQPFVPRSLEEKEEAFRLAAQLVRELKNLKPEELEALKTPPPDEEDHHPTP